MLKKLKTKTIIIGSVILMALVLLLGLTYAYFTARVVGNEDAENTQVYAGIMSLRLHGNTEVSCDNLYPGGQCNINFSVENTGTLPTSYSLDMIEVSNNFANKSDLVYSITSNNKGGAKTETEAPSSNGTLIPVIAIEPGVTQSYTLTLTFKETGENQNVNSNKTFTGKVQISSLDSNNYLASKIIMNNKYMGSDPQYNASSGNTLSLSSVSNTWNNTYPTAEEFVHGSVKLSLSDPSLKTSKKTSTISGNRTLAAGYELYWPVGSNNPKMRLIGVSENQTYDENAVGKYSCASAIGKPITSIENCPKIMKILEVETSNATHDYSQSEATNDTTVLTSNSDKLVGTNYTFNEDSGNYTITNTTSNVTYSSDHINYYTCNTNSDTCNTMYQIKSVSEGNVTNSLKYSNVANYNYASKVNVYSTIYSVVNNDKGVYATEDEEGTSYYLRGDIENNYIRFGSHQKSLIIGDYLPHSYVGQNYPGTTPYREYNTLQECQAASEYNNNCRVIYQQGDPIIWQVIRVNGNGSIRIMAMNNVAGSDYNPFLLEKSGGYTYDNDHLCTKDNPCNSTTGTSSHIKSQLEDWYESDIVGPNLDNNVIEEYYCNDTSTAVQVTYPYPNADKHYSSYERLRTGTPSLKCNNPTDTYGGLYKLKVGLINSDEMNYSGLGWYSPYNSGSYLQARAGDGMYWYMSPLYAETHSYGVYNYISGSVHGDGGQREIGQYYKDMTVNPVINLRSDVVVTSGDGTRNNPYVIQ